jgi:cell division initiation protein
LEASFSKSFRGYDVSEVDTYVQSVQNQEAESQNALAKLNQKTAELEAEVARLREIESSLFRALKLAEESQQNFAAKMEKEAKSILDKASKEAEAIKKKADTDAQKQALLTENERKQTLALANQELKEQERQLRNLQEAKKEIATQLKQISEQTLGSIATWDVLKDITEAGVQPILAPVASKRGRKPGVKNKPKARSAAKLKPAAKTKPASKVKPAARVKPASKVKPAAKVKPASKAKPVTKATPAKRGPKPKIQGEVVASPEIKAIKPAAKVAKPAKPSAKTAAKPTARPAAKRGPKPKVKSATKPAIKRGPKPKISLETVSDDGLPTLNKVLEAYAKSTGPRGKVGEIN